jgi:hypothetical protein
MRHNGLCGQTTCDLCKALMQTIVLVFGRGARKVKALSPSSQEVKKEGAATISEITTMAAAAKTIHMLL